MLKIRSKSKISKARTTVFSVPHGRLETPFFMPDATRAALKNISLSDIEPFKLPAMVVNTFHLMLQPGAESLKKLGGVHRFMGWDKPLLSDSGGFQVYSLIHRNQGFGRINDDHVEFRSPLDGSKHILDAERSIDVQAALGTDMMVVLDDCPPNDADEKTVRAAVSRSLAWAERSSKRFKRRFGRSAERPLLFGVVQGGLDLDLRRECARGLVDIGFDGLGFGARPIDAEGRFLDEVLDVTADAIPDSYLRFGLGIGLPEDIVRCVRLGWDMFDCVIPTREGRHGKLFVWSNARSGQARPFFKKNGQLDEFYHSINISNSRFALDKTPINADSSHPALRQLSKAYLHHLFRVKEPLAARLASLNNLEFYTQLMTRLRGEIKEGKF